MTSDIRRSCCIRDGCGKRFDMNAPETRDATAMWPYWRLYCPDHRGLPLGKTTAIITEVRAEV
jgi:hypothetical protein